MENYTVQLTRLANPSPVIRRDACEVLGRMPGLPAEALEALTQAARDHDADVRHAASEALRFAASTQNPGVSPRQADRNPIAWLLLGIIAGGMLIGARANGTLLEVGMVLAVLAIGLANMILPARASNRRIARVWSELAQRTGLSFLSLPQEGPDLGQLSRLGGLHGTYRGRRISVNKRVRWDGGSTGSDSFAVPVVSTEIVAEVRNPGEVRFTQGARALFEHWFRRKERFGSDDRNLDRHYKFDGTPDDFVREAMRLVANRADLFKRPKGVFNTTDLPLVGTNWVQPTINLEGSALVCVQHGIQGNIDHQVQMLDLLCSLADLAERQR